MSVTIDPRRHDAVLFDLDDPAADDALVTQLRDAGVSSTNSAGHSPRRRAGRDGEPAGRAAGPCAVVTATEDGVTAARAGGFALVIGVDPAGPRDELRSRGADAVIRNLREIRVRTGDRRMSELPDGLQALGLTTERQPAVFFDFDGTLSEIVENPDSARLVDGAADALTSLSAQCPVAILSGRDLADVRQRIGLPGIWYAGSHGFELTGPDGAHHQNAEAAASIPVLAEAAGELADQLGHIPGVVVEHKRFGVAVHYRNAARDRVGEVAAAVRSAGQRTALRVTTGVKSSSYVQMSTGTREKRCVGCSTTSATTKDRARCCRSTSATTSPTRTRLTRYTTTVSRSWCGTATTGTAPPPPRYALDDPDRVREFTERLARQLAS